MTIHVKAKEKKTPTYCAPNKQKKLGTTMQLTKFFH